MTSVNNTSNGVAEEKGFDSFNVSQGKEALELASEDSFQSIGSPPSVDTQSNSDSLDTTADLSGESSLPSPDSAIGGTPGLTPDLELPGYHTPIGKGTGEEKDISEKTGKNTPANAAPVKELFSKDINTPQKEPQVDLEDDVPSEDLEDTAEEEDGKVPPDAVEAEVKKTSALDSRKKVEREDTTEEEEDKKAAPIILRAPPEVKNDKIEDGGYEEDEEDEEGEIDDDDLVLSDSEMVVEASMKFPLANKVNGQDAPVEQKQSDAPACEEPCVAEPVSEVAVKMNIQVTQAPIKEATPSGCESDIEDNDEDDSTEVSIEAPVAPSDAPALAAPTNRIPASIELPETVVRLDTPQGSSVFLVGTAHFSRESQDDVANTIRAVKPDIVVVELCKARTAILQLDEETILEESRSLDFRKVQMILRQHGKVQGILYLLLLSVSAHITKQLGMAPGGEFRTAFAEARRSAPGCLIQFGDRPIQVTLSRALASLSLWHKIKLTWHILTSKEPISKEEVEKCKQRDFIEEMLAEMTGQFPAISEVFVKERDIYLCRSLQAAAQPVPNPMSPSGIAPRIVVGVVGIGHVPGIVERWGKVTDDDIPPIMMIPPTSLSTRVLKFTLKVSFYGLLGYGAYKCLPSSTKSSVQSSVQSVLKAVADSLPQKWLK